MTASAGAIDAGRPFDRPLDRTMGPLRGSPDDAGMEHHLARSAAAQENLGVTASVLPGRGRAVVRLRQRTVARAAAGAVIALAAALRLALVN